MLSTRVITNYAHTGEDVIEFREPEVFEVDGIVYTPPQLTYWDDIVEGDVYRHRGRMFEYKEDHSISCSCQWWNHITEDGSTFRPVDENVKV